MRKRENRKAYKNTETGNVGERGCDCDAGERDFAEMSSHHQRNDLQKELTHCNHHHRHAHLAHLSQLFHHGFLRNYTP